MEGSTIIHLYNRKRGVIYEAASREVVVSVPVPDTSFLSKLFLRTAVLFFGIGILVLGIYYWPNLSAMVPTSPRETSVSKAILETVSGVNNIRTANPSIPLSYQPRFDASLPTVSLLKIPSIGVNSTLQEATYDNYEAALKKGPWRVSDFGTPADRERPTIIAAHRFGYLAWSNVFRRKSSFYNLPKLAVGDTVEIDWGQRKYIYEIYAEDKGDKITDYSADLILYTCEDLSSEVRIFRYGRLLQI